MDSYKDMRGVVISVGDYIVYGKSNRNYPVHMGTVMSIEEDGIKVLGDGNTKQGKLTKYWAGSRVLVLPDNYRSKV